MLSATALFVISENVLPLLCRRTGDSAAGESTGGDALGDDDGGTAGDAGGSEDTAGDTALAPLMVPRVATSLRPGVAIMHAAAGGPAAGRRGGARICFRFQQRRSLDASGVGRQGSRG